MKSIRYYQQRIIIGGLLLGSLALLPFGWQSWVNQYHQQYIYSIDDVPEKRVAIVFGARVYRSGRLSGMLRDRVETAVRLYQTGKVDTLVMSGGSNTPSYNEPDSMAAYAIHRGVPAAAIQADYGGLRTYDSCYRAQAVFQLESAILVTQQFHLPRALFTCQQLGVQAIGVPADIAQYRRGSVLWSEWRETLAVNVALLDVLRRQPATILSPPTPLE